MASETLVKVENLHKKFCRSLKRSLWYGIRDMGTELRGSSRENISLRKDEFWALENVSFEIKKSELVGLIGANGAGKTTILKLLSGLIKPDKGVITIRGKIQALIALGAGFNPILTGRENIYINGAILGFSKKEIDCLLEEIMDFSEIGEFIDMPVQSYSSGMQVRLGFAVAVNLKPDILIVDEVLAVGDASFRRKARKKMMELLHSGISVLFVSHNMALVSSMTSRCIYLDKGRVAAVGPSAEVTARYLSDSLRKPGENRGDEEQEDFLMTSAYLTVPDIFLLKKFHIRNRSGEDSHEFNTYDNIKLTFEMQFLKPVEKVLLAFNIRDQVDDVVISSCKMRLDDRPCVDTMTVECEIKNNKLREGSYNIGFYASDYDGGSLYKSHSVGDFTILADMAVIEKADSTQGFMVIDTAWNVL
jgi:ABC-type polysaccharide/polyol phosphate transport system ATPase subunit